jgi:hypothetical protein
MIAEWIEYLTTSCPSHVREMGYLRESIGIRSRYRRQARAWAPHLENSRRVILSSVARCDNRHTAVIFGGGLIFDLPLAELVDAFDQIILVDLVHLRPARQAARRWQKVRLETLDLTASLEGFHRGERDVVRPPFFLDDPSISLVVSANIASQLSVLPVEWLSARFGMDEDAGENLARQLVREHLDYLRRFNCPVCLISDIARVYHDRKGDQIGHEDALHGIDPGPVEERWSWNVAPVGEVDRHQGVTNEVAALCF